MTPSFKTGFLNPFDPGGGHCYWGPIKPCKSNETLRSFVANGSVTRG